jgi:hypothetical protein
VEDQAAEVLAGKRNSDGNWLKTLFAALEAKVGEAVNRLGAEAPEAAFTSH